MFMKHLLQRHLIFAVLFAFLLSACGGKDSTTTTNTNKTTTSTAAPSVLLGSLALAFPNGQMPADKVAQAARELAQNPAALKLTAENSKATVTKNVQAQAVITDYRPVTRIQNTTLTGAYFFTIYDTEQAAALANNPNWRLEGPAFWASLAVDPALNPVHRFRNVLNGSYLYTIYDTEKADIITNYNSTFVYEGVAWYAKQTPGTGWSALYRFRNLLNGTYLFSAYESEKDDIVANYSAVFQLEGTAYYVRQDAPATVPVAEALRVLDAAATNPVLDRTASLSGTDANSNGVRDDIDRYIDLRSDTAPQKQSLRMVSKAMTAAMASAPTDAIALRSAADALNMGVACLWKNYPPDVANKMTLEMRKVTINTKNRYDAYMRYNGLRAGSVIKLPKEVVCE